MLVVLGDVSAKGNQLSRSKWLSVLHQLQHLLGPFLGLPLHIVLGDRDIGHCNELDLKLVEQISSSLPGLDSVGCGVFDVNNISFISLNAIAMLCKNDLHSHVEKVIERMNQERQRLAIKGSDRSFGPDQNGKNFQWRENPTSGARPVLLLHFPLHKTTDSNKWTHKKFHEALDDVVIKDPDRASVDDGSHELPQTIPLNVTEYMLQALKPRVVFSAHTHVFGDHIHKDGTREVSVPTMAWDVTEEPGFVMASFGENEGVAISHCSLARQSYVLMAYVSLLVLLISTTLIMSRPLPHNSLN
ncbi:Metallophosphoesterase 1 [Nymphaea thermarum]|nr:Metallophosphoesterase 1 [Nymphaea thermarum]